MKVTNRLNFILHQTVLWICYILIRIRIRICNTANHLRIRILLFLSVADMKPPTKFVHSFFFKILVKVQLHQLS
jgi:hypothetical protein